MKPHLRRKGSLQPLECVGAPVSRRRGAYHREVVPSEADPHGSNPLVLAPRKTRARNYTAHAGEHCATHRATQFAKAVRLRSVGAALTISIARMMAQPAVRGFSSCCLATRPQQRGMPCRACASASRWRHSGRLVHIDRSFSMQRAALSSWFGSM